MWISCKSAWRFLCIIHEMKLSVVTFFAAFSAFAGTGLVWDEPAWERVPHGATVEAGALEFKSGDQHVLSFSGGVVRAHHSVTDRTFDFAKTPFDVGPEGWVLPEGEGALLLASGRRDGEGRFEVAHGRLATTSSIGAVDLAVISLYFLGMLLLGFVFMRRAGKADDYFRGGGACRGGRFR